MVRSRACWAKAVLLSKVIDLRRAGLIRANTASITDMVSAAVFPVSLARSVTRDLRSWRTSTGRVQGATLATNDQVPRDCIALGALEGLLRRVAFFGSGVTVGGIDAPELVAHMLSVHCANCWTVGERQ